MLEIGTDKTGIRLLTTGTDALGIHPLTNRYRSDWNTSTYTGNDLSAVHQLIRGCEFSGGSSPAMCFVAFRTSLDPTQNGAM